MVIIYLFLYIYIFFILRFYIVKQFDEKYRVWDKAVNIDQKYKIQEKVQSAAQNAQTRAQAALQTPTGQKVQDFAANTLTQIAGVHYEAKKIQVRYLCKKKPPPSCDRITQNLYRVKS
jgi:hypothetical protein